MARKSRRQDVILPQNMPSHTADVSPDIKAAGGRIFHAALYARLSLESEANRDRCTIETQMQLLHSYVDGSKDIVAEKEYFDISQTGTDFDRAGFEEMIQDMRSGRVDCIIVKDMSRLGRNYIETGNYVERIFPFFGVRFIAVTDGYDSEKNDVDLMVCLSNIFNEYYSRDLAKKIRASYRANWNEGKCVAGNICYGLMKDPNDKHKLIPDPETAPIVREIFAMFIEGKEYAEIARTLEGKHIINPAAYKKAKRGGTLADGEGTKWTRSTIKRLICNRYLVGDSVHNQNRHDSFAEKKQTANPESEWVIIENTHEGVVSREIFDKAQEEMKRRSEVPIKKPGMYKAADQNLFKGKIKCADCGNTMYLQTHNAGVSLKYVCGGYMFKKSGCKSHSVDAKKIYDETLRVIHAHIKVYLDTVEMVRRLNSRQSVLERYDVISKEIRRLQKELKKLNVRKSQLYEDYSLKLIDEEQYVEFKERDARLEKNMQKRLDDMLLRQSLSDRNFHTDEEWEKIIESYRNKRQLTKPMVDAFVDAILVEHDGNINIKLRYDDMLKELVKLAKDKEAGDDC